MSQLNKKLIKQIDNPSEEKETEGGKIDTKYLIPSGTTHLNCALSDNAFGGYNIGKIANIIGDSFTGKTVLALSCLAEVSMKKRFTDFQLIYDDSEAACEFDISRMFGKRLADRLIIEESNTVEEVYSLLLKLIRKGEPFIYFQDSLDSLTCEEEMKRVDAKILKEKGGEASSGSYKMEKPKLMSEMLRVLKKDIKKVEGFVCFVSQTRDNIGPGAMFRPKTRTGGQALTFYCSHIIWLAVDGKITDGQGRTKVELGHDVEARVTKTKLTGKKRNAYFPIMDGYGIDDLASCIYFLIDAEHWKKEKNSIVVPEWDFRGLPSKFLNYAIENKLTNDIKKIVNEQWIEIEKSREVERPGRFDK